MSLIPNTDYSYDYLYDKVYESCDIDSNEISKLLKNLNVEYIYTRTPIETYEFSLYSILEEYGGYLYKANQYMFEVSNIIDEDAIANGMKDKGVILSTSISDEIKKYNTELRVSCERNDLSEKNNFILNSKINSIIDEDVFFFPFLSNVESTSSPTILCNINRGMGLNIFTHFKVVLSNENVTKSIYSSYE